MLNLTADTTSNIYLWMNGDTCLTNLTIVVEPSCINSSTRATNLTMQNLSQLEQLVEALLRTYTISTSNNDRSTLEIVLSSLNMVVENLYYISLWRYIL